GAYNMKGGVAAAAEALLAIASVADRLSGEIWVAGVAGESEKAQVRGLARDFNGPDYLGGGIGADRLLATGPKVDAVVVCEPSGLTVVNAQPGYLLIQLRVLGRSRYLPSPADPTAIKGLAAVIAALEAWAATYADRAAIDCGTGILRPTTTIGAVEAGAPYKPGGAPDAAALYLDVRVPPGLDADDLVAEIRATAAGALGSHGPTSGLTLETEVFARNVPGAITPVDHPLVQAAQQARTSTLGLPTERVPDADLTAGDDGKVFARAGIPYVKIGPGSATGRDPRFGREQVRIDDLEMAARIYVELAARLTEPSHDFALTPSRTMGPSPGIGSRMA
ncbi:MAG TPA: M20/M25/M40 family metallo-hydrolase, partial [Candidatus Limnocylindrales bacterium]|nr:M20/M25/M40 family metallo-hydrolase [Candidatus Limnocylindrales bacterium]